MFSFCGEVIDRLIIEMDSTIVYVGHMLADHFDVLMSVLEKPHLLCPLSKALEKVYTPQSEWCAKPHKTIHTYHVFPFSL